VPALHNINNKSGGDGEEADDFAPRDLLLPEQRSAERFNQIRRLIANNRDIRERPWMHSLELYRHSIENHEDVANVKLLRRMDLDEDGHVPREEALAAQFVFEELSTQMLNLKVCARFTDTRDEISRQTEIFTFKRAHRQKEEEEKEDDTINLISATNIQICSPLAYLISDLRRDGKFLNGTLLEVLLVLVEALLAPWHVLGENLCTLCEIHCDDDAAIGVYNLFTSLLYNQYFFS
jgi:hypothetical protein